MHTARKVSAHMTTAPHAIGAEAPLAEAQHQMRALALAQLPVLVEGKPHGVLLDRDLQLAQRLGVDFASLSVRDLLPRDAFSITPDESLASAVRAMASRAACCAVVVEGASVRGVLTTHDALTALADLLENEEAERSRESREICVVDDEECLLSRAEELARRIVQGHVDEQSMKSLRAAVKELYEAQMARLSAEERTLACTSEPSLRRSQLALRREGHEAQAKELEGVLMRLDDLAQPPAAVAASVLQAIEHLRDEAERDRDPISYVS